MRQDNFEKYLIDTWNMYMDWLAKNAKQGVEANWHIEPTFKGMIEWLRDE